MILLLGSIGWGLLAFGAITHVWHHDRLRALLALHLDHERLPASLLTATEEVLSLTIPLAFLADWSALAWLSLAAALLGLGFVGWIGRLLLTGSDLPCACSFSDAPTSWWSFARSVCVLLVATLAVTDVGTGSSAEQVATFAAGWALAAAIFVVPEAVTWPDASKALMTRVDAHTAS